jgi:nicotinamide-nucleotide amidase
MRPVTTAEILAVGSELLTPHRIDTNSLHLTDKLNALGIDVRFKGVVGDDPDALAGAFRTALSRADLVISTGGLGPTADDLTREAVALVLGRALLRDASVEAAIRRRFEQRRLHMPDGNLKQADVPAGGEALPNPNGTAPGIWIAHGDQIIVLLPGPPREMREIYTAHVAERLHARTGGRQVRRRMIRIAGRAESHVDEIAAPIYTPWASSSIPIETSILASPGQIELHLSARGDDLPAIDRALDAAVRTLAEALAPAVFSVDGRSLEAVVGELLHARNWTLAVAESCTGGLVGARLTDVPGSSVWFAGGVIAYANESKLRDLGVDAALLDRHGAVSEPVADAMADGVRTRFATEAAISITGIAGPDGGTPDKPVGTVAIAMRAGQARQVRTFRFAGDRQMVRQQSVIAALEMLRQALIAPL